MDERVFLFAANPDQSDGLEHVKKFRSGHIQEWAVSQQRAKMRTDDIVLLWNLKGSAIEAVGRIVAPPRKLIKQGDYSVWWVVSEVLDDPIDAETIVSKSDLESSLFGRLIGNEQQHADFLLAEPDAKALFVAFPHLASAAQFDAIELAVRSIVKSEGLVEKCQSILSDSVFAMWLEIRRYRVRQIQEMFRVGPIDWNLFQKEVWPVGGVRIDGQTYTPLDRKTIPPESVFPQIEDQTLNCFGNSLWAPATGVFGTKLTHEERVAGVEKMRRILISDSKLEDKYLALKSISGLGPSVSSGFLAIFHPDSWALRNGPIIANVDRLHLDSSEAGFQKTAAVLKDALKLKDFLELDIVLYQLRARLKPAQTQFWWVNLVRSLEELQGAKRLQSPSQEQDEDDVDWLRLNPGDIVYAHRNGKIVAKLRIADAAQPIPEDEGRFEVPVEVEPYGPIAVESLVMEGLPVEQNGKPMPGYLFRLPGDLQLRAKPTRTGAKKFIKVSPWNQSEFWPKCLEEKGMMVGWRQIGNLMDYQSVDELRVAMASEYSETQNETPFYRFSQDLWAYRNLEPGDVIVANKGMSEVLALGVVQEPGYQYREDLFPAPNFVPVEWNLSYAKKIPRQNRWGQRIFRDISDDVLKMILEPQDESTVPKSPSNAKAIILYGPPGTGKTFVTRRRAVDLAMKTPVADADISGIFSDLSASGRIHFITFHQSFGYEEFVEGIRPVGNNENEAVSFEVRPGLFVNIAMHAAAAGVKKAEATPTFDSLWSALLDEIQKKTVEDGQYWINAPGERRYLAAVTSSGNINAHQWHEVDGVIEPKNAFLRANKAYARVLWARRDELDDSYSASTISTIVAEGVGTGGGCHENVLWAAHQRLLELATAASPGPASVQERMEIARDLLEGRSAEGEFDFDGADQYVLIIDEINRGNISKILGELITLLEPSKRLKKEDELIVRLPYSGRAFGVPPNLHVIGTMNTADRSIALLDVALRRRFTFEEIMPKADVLRTVLADKVDDVDDADSFIQLVVQVFETINKRVQFLYDRDHMIGHAYYLQATNHEAFRDVLLKSVIPLLQEYFYGSWDLVCTALGCPYHEDGKARRSSSGYAYPLVKPETSRTSAVLGFDHEDFEDKLEFAINPRFQNEEASVEELELFFKGIL